MLLLKINNFYSLASKEAVLKELETKNSFNACKEFAESNFKHLSSGSSRIVYLTSDKTVIKLAKNEKGVAQNKAEATLKTKSPILNKILSNQKKFLWIETEFLDKVSQKEFEKLTDLNFNHYSEAISYALKDISKNSHSKPKNYDSIKNNKFFKQIVNVAKENNLLGGDLGRISSFGKKDNHIVILDAGLTKKIYDKYYE